MTKRRDFQNNKEISFESSALNGLRGFAAIHVLISHSFLHSSWRLHFNGHVSYSVDIEIFLTAETKMLQNIFLISVMLR